MEGPHGDKPPCYSYEARDPQGASRKRAGRLKPTLQLGYYLLRWTSFLSPVKRPVNENETREGIIFHMSNRALAAGCLDHRQIQLLAKLPPHKRVRVILQARVLEAGMMRG